MPARALLAAEGGSDHTPALGNKPFGVSCDGLFPTAGVRSVTARCAGRQQRCSMSPSKCPPPFVPVSPFLRL